MDQVQTKTAADSSIADEATATPAADQTMTMSFYNSLEDVDKKAFQEKAPVILDKFIQNDDSIVSFGEQSVTKINSVVQDILESQKKIEIPEVDELMVNANRELDNFNARYKKQRASVDGFKNKFMGWLHGAKRSVEDWKFEQEKTAKQFDEIDNKIVQYREKLIYSSSQTKNLMEANKESTNSMIGILAALEVTYQEAIKQSVILQDKLSKLSEGTPAYHDVYNQRERIMNVANAIEQQHAAYMSRLAIAWATDAQVSNIIRISRDTIFKLNLIHTQTIPVMKLTVSQLGMVGELQDASHASKVMTDADSKATQMWAHNAAVTIPQLQKEAQAPIKKAEDVMAMADAIVAENQGVIDALKQGREDRIKLEHAVLEAGNKISESNKVRDEELVKVLLNQKAQDEDVINGFSKAAEDAYQTKDGFKMGDDASDINTPNPSTDDAADLIPKLSGATDDKTK